MRRALRTLLALAILSAVSLAATPAATAHTTTSTTDGKYLITAGNLDEPVTTYMKTGLDLLIRANTTARPGIAGAHLTLQATLVAPGGDELTRPLRTQFGVPGGYTFDEPYVLTEPGTYNLRLTGRINDTTVNIPALLVGSGPVPAMEDVAFPGNLSNPGDLGTRLRTLETQNAQLRSDLDALKRSPEGRSPGVDALALGGLGALVVAFLARRRRD